MLLKKIVVAEDDDAIAHLVNMALGDAGFLCLRARDGVEAMNLVQLHAPDLLVLDVMMPRLSGHEVAKKIKGDAILSRTPILMLTALSSVDDKIGGFDSGADDYLVKPFDLRELSARVQALIRTSRRERDRNSTTNLPGAAALEDAVGTMLKDKRDSSIVHFDLVGFGAYADEVGYAGAESLVVALGQLVLEFARARGAEFVCHLGGVDFIVLMPTADAEPLAALVVAAFQDRRADWPSKVELAMKGAVVPATGATGEDELSTRLQVTMRAAKQREGSTYVVWGPALA
ncbi:MAG TPA: response regulator [Kofleriaceae bacterium]|nr:response regulator [Kofleriaceae bacterium]